jgi:hypothetical protein
MMDENEVCCESKEVITRKPSIMEKLQQKKEKCQAELKEIENTITLFEKHPEFEQCLTQLSRIGIYR